MTWNWYAWFATAGFMFVSALVAAYEGTLTRHGFRRVKMPLVNHGGMWSDALILPVVNALLIPPPPAAAHSALAIVLTGVGSVLLTFKMHGQWYVWLREQGHTCHMWPRFDRGQYSDISLAGRLHVMFMAAELVILGLAFLLSPLPRPTLLWVAALLSVHITVGTIQPGWFVTGRWIGKGTVPVLGASLVAIWLVAILKL